MIQTAVTYSIIASVIPIAFEIGQIYVALSRAKNLEGLHLKGLNPKNIRAHPKAKAFYLNQQKEIKTAMNDLLSQPIACD